MVNRVIASELRTLNANLPESLTAESIPPGNPNTRSATVYILKGGPLFITTLEGREPSELSHPINLGDELDVIGAEDLRLLRMMVIKRTDIEIIYSGGGDQL